MLILDGICTLANVIIVDLSQANLIPRVIFSQGVVVMIVA